jgi:hypothetical protein
MVVLAFTGVASVQRTAHASSNGQQIQFSCASMGYGMVKGNNQYGRYAVWQGSARAATGYNFFITQGWWWVGRVQVFWYNPRINHWYSTQLNVPKQQQGDIVYARC